MAPKGTSKQEPKPEAQNEEALNKVPEDWPGTEEKSKEEPMAEVAPKEDLCRPGLALGQLGLGLLGLGLGPGTDR